MTAEISIALESANSSDWITGAVGIIGALAGSALTLYGTDRFEKNKEKRKLVDSISVACFKFYIEIGQMYDVSRTFDIYLQEGIKNHDPSKSIYLFTSILPLVAPQKFVEFDHSMYVDLRNTKDGPLFNSVLGLDSKFNHLVSTMNRYDEERRWVLERLTPVETSDGVTSIELSAQLHAELAPWMGPLDGMIKEMADLASDHRQATFLALKRLLETDTRPLGSNFSITLYDLDDNQIILPSKIEKL